MVEGHATRPGLEVRFEVVDPRRTEAVAAMEAYFAELDERFPNGFDAGDAATADAEHFEAPSGAFVLAFADGTVAGCGAVQTIADEVGEIKRMWIAPDQRGRGIARQLLERLEAVVADLGHTTIRLDTNAVLTDAIRMYERAGYRRIDRYNDNAYAELFFEKPAPAQPGR